MDVMRSSTLFSQSFVSPAPQNRATSVKEQDEEIERLKKVNFELKLKIYHLQDRLENSAAAVGSLPESELTRRFQESQVMINRLREEVDEKNKLLVKAKGAISKLSNTSSDASQVEDYRLRVEDLERRLVEADERYRARSEELVLAREQNGRMEQQIERLRASQIQAGEIAQMSQRLRLAEEELRRREDAMSSAQQIMQEQRARIADLEFKCEDAQRERDRLRQGASSDSEAARKAATEWRERATQLEAEYRQRVEMMQREMLAQVEDKVKSMQTECEAQVLHLESRLRDEQMRATASERQRDAEVSAVRQATAFEMQRLREEHSRMLGSLQSEMADKLQWARVEMERLRTIEQHVEQAIEARVRSHEQESQRAKKAEEDYLEMFQRVDITLTSVLHSFSLSLAVPVSSSTLPELVLRKMQLLERGVSSMCVNMRSAMNDQEAVMSSLMDRLRTRESQLEMILHRLRYVQNAVAEKNVRLGALRRRCEEWASRAEKLGESNRLLILEVDEKRLLAEKVNTKFSTLRTENAQLRAERQQLIGQVQRTRDRRDDVSMVANMLEKMQESHQSVLRDIHQQVAAMHAQTVRLTEWCMRTGREGGLEWEAVEHQCRTLYRQSSELASVLASSDKQRHEDFVKLRTLIREFMVHASAAANMPLPPSTVSGTTSSGDVRSAIVQAAENTSSNSLSLTPPKTITSQPLVTNGPDHSALPAATVSNAALKFPPGAALSPENLASADREFAVFRDNNRRVEEELRQLREKLQSFTP
jgi:uncharacterized phage infection (PIP) family protein YhgE